MGRILWCSLILMAACGAPTDNSDKQVFRYNEAEGITSLDPAFARNLEHIWAVDQLFDGLVEMGPDMIVRPAIASSWDITDSGKTYVFHLRSDVRFHDDACFIDGDGRSVIASDALFSYQRIIDGATASPGRWIFDQVADMKVKDDHTFVIRLKESFPPFLGILSMGYASIVPQEALEKYGSEWRSHPVGAGPFRFAHWKEGVKLALLKNEHYYQRDDEGGPVPYIDAVLVSFVKDRNAAFLNMMKGELDMLSGLEGSYKNELLDPLGQVAEDYMDKVTLIRTPWLKTDYLGFLMDTTMAITKGTPWRDVRIRKAINHAIDRPRLVKYLLNGIGIPAIGGFIPAGLPAYDPTRNQGYAFDVDRSRELLAEAGFPNGEGLPPLVLTTTATHMEMCEFIQHELHAIGVNVQVDVVPLSNHKEGVAHGDILFFRKNWLADYPDEENFLLLFYSGNKAPNGPNYCRFSNALFDELYERSLVTSEPLARRELYQRMDSIIIAEAPVVFLYYPEVVRFVRKDITGLGGDPMNALDLRRVRKTN